MIAKRDQSQRGDLMESNAGRSRNQANAPDRLHRVSARRASGTGGQASLLYEKGENLFAGVLCAQVLYVRALQLAGLAALGYALLVHEAHQAWWLVSFAVYFASCCLGISITYHRSLAHDAFKLPKPLEYLFAWIGAIGGAGSAIGWVAMHREHHACADGPGDPHAPAEAGLMLLFSGYDFAFNSSRWRVRDLVKDPFHMFVHRYYLPLIVAWAAGLALIDLNALIFAFLIPAGLVVTVLNLANLLTHSWGYKNFQTNDHSYNNWFVSLLTWGEGWHNNHHHRPQAWNLRSQWWEFDPAAGVIHCLRQVVPIKFKHDVGGMRGE